jgi:hypothetical protein
LGRWKKSTGHGHVNQARIRQWDQAFSGIRFEVRLGVKIKRSSIQDLGGATMCHNIKPLYNFEPPASDADVQAAALQFVRKISGFNKPSKANEQAFEAAVQATAQVAQQLLAALVTSAPPRSREEFEAQAKQRSQLRFAPKS